MTNSTNANLTEVAIIGNSQVGKSTLVACLLGDNNVLIGKDNETARRFTFSYRDCNSVEPQESFQKTESFYSKSSDLKKTEIICHNNLSRQIILIDTHGFCEIEKIKTHDAISKSDIVVFVHENDDLKDEIDGKILNDIKINGKRLLFLINCKRVWKRTRFPDAKDNIGLSERVLKKLKEDYNLENSLIEINGKKVWLCNPFFAMYGQKLLSYKQKKVVEEACENKKWDKENLDNNLLKASGIEELKNLLANASRLPLFNVCNDPEAELRSLTERWANRFSYYKSTKNMKDSKND